MCIRDRGKVVVGDDTNSDPGNVLAGATFVGWRDAERMLLLPEPTSVSYTHLTLPTSDLV